MNIDTPMTAAVKVLGLNAILLTFTGRTAEGQLVLSITLTPEEARDLMVILHQVSYVASGFDTKFRSDLVLLRDELRNEGKTA